MNNAIDRIYINDNALLTQEVADMLDVSRQQVSNLVKQGKLTPVKGSSTASIFLKADIDEYIAKKHGIPLKKDDIIGQQCTRYSMDHFKSIKDRHKDVVAVHVYANGTNAILDGYYTYENKYQKDALLCVAAPTCVLMFNDGSKVYYDGFNCGYNGTGPNGTKEMLMELGASESEAMMVHFCNRISFYKTEGEWQATDRNIHNDIDIKEIYLYNDNLVMILRADSLKEYEECESLLKKYEFFLPRPSEAYVLSEKEAFATGHYGNMPYNRGVYRLIIKDHSGNELWLKAPSDDFFPRLKHKNIEAFLKASGFEISEETKEKCSDGVKSWLGFAPILGDKMVYKNTKPKRSFYKG